VLLKRAGREAGLGRIGIDVDLEQDADGPIPGQARQPLRKGDRIDRLDDIEQLDGAPGLVALELADQVPLDLRQLGHLWRGLLHPVLAHRGQPSRDGGLESVKWDGLGDAHQLDAGRVTTTPDRRGRDASQDALVRCPKRVDRCLGWRSRRRVSRSGVGAQWSRLRRRNAGMSRSSISGTVRWAGAGWAGAPWAGAPRAWG